MTLKGNEVEWQFPHDVGLSGVEFKALVSGSHTIAEDFVYFRHEQYYGLSCSALKSVNNEEERGARMKSVGIICINYTSLHEHQEFLEQQVRQHLEHPHQYEQLTRYYAKYRNCPLQNNFFPLSPPTGGTFGTNGFLGVDDLTVMKISHPTGCFSQFIKFFGVNIFLLWKFVLLQKRILFFAPPPVGIQCYRVYCTGLLGSNAFGLLHTVSSYLLFYISVGRIAALINLDAFVACTTESIFLSKPEVFDLYVDIQKFEIKNEYLKTMTRINSADRARYARLCKYTNEQLSFGTDVTDDEKMYTRFFIEQNNRIFKILHEVSSKEDQILTVEHLREMGLDPYGDRFLVKELIELYNIKINIGELTCCK